MARPTSRRSLRFENLEDRQLLSSGGPTNQQQYMLQLINMARTTPQVAAKWVSNNLTPEVNNTLKHYNVDVNAVKATIANNNPLPPVAWNSQLADAAQSHSQDMADNQYQSHTGSDGSSADDRISRAGYKNPRSTGENAYAYANGVDNATQAFLYDWGVADSGHRRNMMQPGVSAENAFTDVGIGIVNTGGRGVKGKVGPVVVTQDFGSQANSSPKLVGVAYSDDDNSNFYTPGEGKGGVEVDATNLATGDTSSTETWDSGGYQMALSPGRYKVTASQSNVVIKEATIDVGNVNVAQDFVLSDKWDGRPASQAQAAPVSVKVTSAPAPTPSNVAGPKVAFFAPSDWKGTPDSSTAPRTTAAPTETVNVNYKQPLADWTTWKAKAR